MDAFTSFKSIGIPIDITNCDTDQIVPARLLRRPRTDPDYPRYLFHDLRFNPDGTEIPDFIYNQEPFRDGKIIVADMNWGCGSSREHAVYVLVANGIRAVIAPSFGDIHYNNCMKHGVLPVRLSREDCDILRKHMHEAPGAEIEVDLKSQTVTALNGTTFKFDIGPFDKHRMLNGVDDIGMTLQFDSEIGAFEKNRPDYGWL
ncbi:MAG TPA: 3-isopropylmalate dehydratase small subunit [Hyphomicrobiaceae bacterium]|nr:3-isopropylmalate dehydratase small subunit [Hyphomicrobiaceae bacterium]